MTLRLRLVAALVGLVTVGLALFGVGTYTRYRASQYQRLDEQIRGSARQVATQLDQAAGIDDQAASHPQGGPGGRYGGSDFGAPPSQQSPPVVVPSSTWAELLNAQGAVLSTIQLSDSSAAPRLPRHPPGGHRCGSAAVGRVDGRAGRLPGCSSWRPASRTEAPSSSPCRRPRSPRH